MNGEKEQEGGDENEQKKKGAKESPRIWGGSEDEANSWAEAFGTATPAPEGEPNGRRDAKGGGE